eukprot:TRINITY_DN10965_c0_g1_i1.p1 TRINITY_DN10965_c0_g1~~TRINITY_DN10965_c0_g1_i1.p1  ORF type:complete len:145 (-),score=5.03 TRINITY_DN10965_c0_g1_i1:63-434(-)
MENKRVCRHIKCGKDYQSVSSRNKHEQNAKHYCNRDVVQCKVGKCEEISPPAPLQTNNLNCSRVDFRPRFPCRHVLCPKDFSEDTSRVYHELHVSHSCPGPVPCPRCQDVEASKYMQNLRYKN